MAVCRISGSLIYFMFAIFSYLFVFDKRYTRHPKFINNQIRLEIATALKAVPTMAALTVPSFVAEVRGLNFMYDSVSDSMDMHILLRAFGEAWNLLQIPLFLMFTDCGIYWIHRALHSKALYKHLHKPHHQWSHIINGSSRLPFRVMPSILSMGLRSRFPTTSSHSFSRCKS
jgi:lathosterol oxidase